MAASTVKRSEPRVGQGLALGTGRTGEAFPGVELRERQRCLLLCSALLCSRAGQTPLGSPVLPGQVVYEAHTARGHR